MLHTEIGGRTSHMASPPLWPDITPGGLLSPGLWRSWKVNGVGDLGVNLFASLSSGFTYSRNVLVSFLSLSNFFCTFDTQDTKEFMMHTESLVDNYEDPNPLSTQFTGTEGAYLLPHNDIEIERLQRQHRFLGSATNSKLLQYPLQSGAKILDSGCADGTFDKKNFFWLFMHFRILL